MHAVLLFQSTKHQVQVLSPFHASNVNLYHSSFIASLITKNERETTPYKSHYPQNLFSLGTITCFLITQSCIWTTLLCMSNKHSNYNQIFILCIFQIFESFETTYFLRNLKILLQQSAAFVWMGEEKQSTLTCTDTLITKCLIYWENMSKN